MVLFQRTYDPSAAQVGILFNVPNNCEHLCFFNLNSKLQLGPKEVEFAVLAENQEAVMEFCQGGGCTYVGQVIYMEGICKQFTKLKSWRKHLKKKPLLLKELHPEYRIWQPFKDKY